MAKKTIGRQEGWNNGYQNIRTQRKKDARRAARKEKFARKGKRKFGSRKARYRGRQI